MLAPGISKLMTSLATAFIISSGLMSNAAVHQVPVEDHVQVLVGGDAGEQLVGDRVAGGLAGVPVRDAGRQLLEGDVGDRLERRLVAGVVAGGHVVHPGPLELDRVDAAGDDEVVAQRDAVPALLRRPAADPRAPGAVAAEPGGDLAVVAGQVVLGEQVDEHRGLRRVVEPGLLRRPVLAAEEGEVAPLVPRARSRAGAIPWPSGCAGRGSRRPPARARSALPRAGMSGAWGPPGRLDLRLRNLRCRNQRSASCGGSPIGPRSPLRAGRDSRRDRCPRRARVQARPAADRCDHGRMTRQPRATDGA